MKDFFKAIKSAFVVCIVGMSVVLIPTIVEILELFKNKTYWIDIIRNISIIAGGLLVVFVMNREYKLDIKNYIGKPRVDILLNIIFISVFYEICYFYIFYRNDMGGEKYSIQEIIGTMSGAIGAPIGEELIFRFGMLTLLFSVSHKSIIKKWVSILLVSIVFMLFHFPSSIQRALEIVVWSIFVALIYFAFKNIIYCIVFHMISNAVLFTIAMFCNPFVGMNIVFYFSVFLLVIALLVLVKNYYKNHDMSNSRMELIKHFCGLLRNRKEKTP